MLDFDMSVIMRLKPPEGLAGIFMPRQTRLSVGRVPGIVLGLGTLTSIALFM